MERTMQTLVAGLAEALKPIGDEARAAAKALVCDYFDLTPTDLALQFDRAIPQSDADRLFAMALRLTRGEPLQYVTGVAYFAGLKLRVAPGALIPRPETEALVDMAVERAAGRDGARILDVGTGSGCIALAIKSALPSARVTAIDASPDALRVAQANAQTLALDVDIRLVDILSPEAANIGQFDIVVSNPPYVRLSESCSMDTNVLDHEPRMALFVPDDDPLLFYRRIARLSLGGMLAPGGSLLFEINEALGPQTARMLTSLGLRDAAISPDFTGRDRYASCSRQSTTN